MKFLAHILNILRIDLVLSKVVRKAKWGGTYLPNTMDKNINYFSFLLLSIISLLITHLFLNQHIKKLNIYM